VAKRKGKKLTTAEREHKKAMAEFARDYSLSRTEPDFFIVTIPGAGSVNMNEICYNRRVA
jgi:hypothetical protein